MDTFCKLSGLDPLWDWNRTWYTASPDLTHCFQNTVLVWAPCVYLWLLAPFYCLYLYCHGNGRIRISCLCTAKMVLGFLLASFGFVEFFYILLERSGEIHQHMVFLLSPVVRSVTVCLPFPNTFILPGPGPSDVLKFHPVSFHKHTLVVYSGVSNPPSDSAGLI
ncbi:unnamed protein product [Boreogadus saida]